MPALSRLLTNFVQRPVIDVTGLTGLYDFTLDISEEDLVRFRKSVLAGGQAGATWIGGDAAGLAPAAGASDPAGSSMIRAVERLGLKLEAKRMSLPVMVIDSIRASPTEN